MAEFAVKMGDGRSIPLVGLGTYLEDADQAKSSVMAALKAGYRHVDTAAGYSNETGVAAGILESGVPRSDIFICTKVYPGNPAWGQQAKPYEAVIEDCHASLANLQVRLPHNDPPPQQTALRHSVRRGPWPTVCVW